MTSTVSEKRAFKVFSRNLDYTFGMYSHDVYVLEAMIEINRLLAAAECVESYHYFCHRFFKVVSRMPFIDISHYKKTPQGCEIVFEHLQRLAHSHFKY